MVHEFLNRTIFWEYKVEQLDPDEWASFVVKQVFNRNVISLPDAIPALLDYYGSERVEQMLRTEKWLTREGIQTARQYLPHLKKGDFVAMRRINHRLRQLAKVGGFNKDYWLGFASLRPRERVRSILPEWAAYPQVV